MRPGVMCELEAGKADEGKAHSLIGRIDTKNTVKTTRVDQIRMSTGTRGRVKACGCAALYISSARCSGTPIAAMKTASSNVRGELKLTMMTMKSSGKETITHREENPRGIL